jgi:hypothetical protein
MTARGGKTYARKQRRHNARTGNAPNDLCDKDHSEACVGDAANECQAESHSRVEEATRDTEEDPSVDSETEAERQRDVYQRAKGWMSSCAIGVVGVFSFVRNLGAGEGEEEEEECAEELADSLRPVSSLADEMRVRGVGRSYSDDMTADCVRSTAGYKPWLASGVYGIALSCIREDDEAIVNRRLYVHVCCCFPFLPVFLVVFGRVWSPWRRRGENACAEVLYNVAEDAQMLYVGGGGRDGNRPATWKTRCQRCAQKKAHLW